MNKYDGVVEIDFAVTANEIKTHLKNGWKIIESVVVDKALYFILGKFEEKKND